MDDHSVICSPYCLASAFPAFTATTISSAAEVLDLATVMKATQSLSGEIELGKLLATGMHEALRAPDGAGLPPVGRVIRAWSREA